MLLGSRTNEKPVGAWPYEVEQKLGLSRPKQELW